MAPLVDMKGYDRDRVRAERKEAVDSIFSEGLMFSLSLLLIPVLVLPLVLDLPREVSDSLDILNYVVIVAFVLEYGLKSAFSSDRWMYVLNPWHILDLFIIVASLLPMAVGLLPNAGGLPLLLRLLRLPVAISLGGRSLSRKPLWRDEGKKASTAERPLVESVMIMSRPEDGWREVPFPEGRTVKDGGAWRNIFNVSVKDLPQLGRESGLPNVVLEGKIKDRAYPRAETVDGSSVVFLRIPRARGEQSEGPLSNRWDGLLMIDSDKGTITISNSEVPTVLKVPQLAKDHDLELTPAVLFYLLTNESLGSVEELILGAEMELMQLESVPMTKQPRYFLTITYEGKKEVGQIISWLIHTKAICQDALEGKVRLRGWGREDESRTKALVERCEYLLETAENVEGGLADAIDFYLNTNSFQMNRVMRVIAVMTALTVIPTVVGGLMGMNLMGNPWAFSLAQVVTAVAVVMAATAWIYYKLGWLSS